MPLDDLFARQAGWIDDLVGEYERALRAAIARAQATVVDRMREELEISGGRIARTARNQKALRTVEQMVREALDEAGVAKITQRFVGEFAGGLPLVDEMLEIISREIRRPLEWRRGREDQAFLAAQQAMTQDALEAALETAAAAAQRRALFSVGALRFADMVEQIALGMDRSISEATTLGATAVVMFQRSATERAYRQIEREAPKGAVRYRYEGPRDKLTRPFCEEMLRRTARRPMTRDEIERADNGQLPNPFLTGGGYNCRHQWVIAAIGRGDEAGEADE
jgi:hypothetical protein